MSLWIVSYKRNGRVWAFPAQPRPDALKNVRALMQKPHFKPHREEIKLTPAKQNGGSDV